MKILSVFVMSFFIVIGMTSMINFDPPFNAKLCTISCETQVAAGVFQTYGDCRSACSTCSNKSESLSNLSNCLCKVSLEFVGLEHFGFSNHGQCVKEVKKVLTDI